MSNSQHLQHIHHFVMCPNTHKDCYGNFHHTWWAVANDGLAYFHIKSNFTPHGWTGARSNTTQGKHYRVYHLQTEIGRFKHLADAKAMVQSFT